MDNTLLQDLDIAHQDFGIKKVTQNQYKDWCHGFVFDGLRNLSYGQSFCRRFGIQDYILNRSDSGHRMDYYIRKHYVR